MTEPLSLEEFTKQALNFSHHFANLPGMDNHLRTSEYFKMFQKEHPSLDKSLTEMITSIWNSAEDHVAGDYDHSAIELRHLEQDYKLREVQKRQNLILLYAAYKCMRKYVDDEDFLFR